MTIYRCTVEVDFKKICYIDVGDDEEVKEIHVWETTKEKEAKKKAVDDALEQINRELESLRVEAPPLLGRGWRGEKYYGIEVHRIDVIHHEVVKPMTVSG